MGERPFFECPDCGGDLADRGHTPTCPSLSSPFAEATPHMIACYEMNMEAYRLGLLKPNYPPPCTLDNGESAANYLHLSLCPMNPPCGACIDKWLNQLDWDSWEAFPTNLIGML